MVKCTKCSVYINIFIESVIHFNFQSMIVLYMWYYYLVFNSNNSKGMTSIVFCDFHVKLCETPLPIRAHKMRPKAEQDHSDKIVLCG